MQTENVDRVARLAVVLDFLLGAVLLVVGVGNGVALVAVGVDFENGWAGLVVGAFDGLVHAVANGVDGFSANGVPIHVVAFGASCEAAFGEGAGALLGSPHAVAVVLDDVDDRQVPKGGEVEGFVEGALIDGSVSEETHAAAFDVLVFKSVGEACSERGLAANDSVASPVVLVGREVVHGTAFSLGAAGRLALEFGHALVHGHADGEGVPVVAVGGYEVIVVSHERCAAGDYGLLADVKVEKSADLALLVDAQ